MQDAIRDSARTLAVLSSAYLDSAYGSQEWQAAIAADPDSARRRLIPVRVEDCARPGLLGQVVSFDLFGLAEHRARGELLERVREAIAGRAKPAHQPLFPGDAAVAALSAVSPAFPGTEADPQAAPREEPAEFHALLVGIGSYDDERLPALPWLSGMLDSAAEHLESVGYRAEIHDRSRSGAGAVKVAVHGFLRGAAPGSTLLLLLAGNAVHRAARGAEASRDFLVPADATVGYQPFWDLCVPVDWSGALAHTGAARVLVLVDGMADYDDTVRDEVTDRGWGAGHVEPAPGVDVAYIYRHHGTAVDSSTSGDPVPRSSLTRALIDVLSTRPLPVTVTELHRTLENVLAGPRSQRAASSLAPRSPATSRPGLGRKSTRDWSPGAQREECCLLRALSPCDPLRFHPFPVQPDGDTEDAPPHAWTQVAKQHRAWDYTPDTPARAALQAATSDLVARLGRTYDAATAVLANDPWHDPDLARRMVRRVEFLVGRLPDGPDHLSAAEAALLVAGPFLHQTIWTVLVARATTAHPGSADSRGADRSDFDAFATTYPRLMRRIERAGLAGDPASATSVAWWLAHKWCETHVTARWEGVLHELVAGLGATGGQESLAAEVFRTDRIVEILTSLRATATFLNQPGRVGALRDLVMVAPATSDEMPLRERLVGYLLAVGQKMALEIAALPPVLVEHLGVADAVDLTDVRMSLRRAEWQGGGRSTRALAVECRHPALQVALEKHTEGLDALLAEAHRATAEIPALAGLPTHATADGVRAAEIDGHPRYTNAGAQFRLAEDRVQELLMGEQLYENRALAVRELYQNALDACRYRRARTEYLARTTGRPSSWTGRIDFRQGFEPDGTPYIECSDNGIGMGYREITDVFAEAGTRTVDLPEVVEEMGRWAACDPPVEFHPNSRFGVGVLSYFMIADEIRVETCRLGPDGRPGELLRVTIAGPGNLFRIEPLGPGGQSGTSVRLYLSRDPKRPPISCVDILRRILWVAEFETRATEGAALEAWPAGVLAPSAPVGMLRPLEGLIRRETTQIINADNNVWWCNGVGAMISDGLWVGEPVYGVILNLTGILVPELSVDRNKIRKLLEEPKVDALLSAALPVLRASDALDVSVEWLTAFAYSFPLVADTLIELMAVEGESWAGLGRNRVSVARSGLLAIDSALWLGNPQNLPAVRSGVNPLYPFQVPDSVFFARVASWSEVDPDDVDMSGRNRVVPSDLGIVTMGGYSFGPAPDLTKIEISFLAGVLRTSPKALLDRARRLGYRVPSLKGIKCEEVTEIDTVVLSDNLDGKFPTGGRGWRGDRVSPGHVLAAAARSLVNPVEVDERLTRLGVLVWPPLDRNLSSVPMDLVMQSEDLDGRHPWLSAGRVSRAHVLRSALYTGLSPTEVVSRLQQFGYRRPRGAWIGKISLKEGDASIVSQDGSNALTARPVPTSYLRSLQAEDRGMRGNSVERIRQLGFPVARDLQLPNNRLDELANRFPQIRRDHPLWSTARPVNWADILSLASAAGMSYAAIFALCRDEGYVVADVGGLRDSAFARLLEVSAASLQRISKAGCCEIGDMLSISASEGIPWGDVIEYLEEAGIAFPDVSDLEITHDDNVVLSTAFSGRAELANFSRFVPAAHVNAAAARLRKEPQVIVYRLCRLGFVAADPAGIKASPVRPSDLSLLARDFDDRGKFISDERVSAAHVLRVAAQTGQGPRAVAERLRQLGFEVEEVADVTLTAAEECTLVEMLDVTAYPSEERGSAGLSRSSILAVAFRITARRHPRRPAELAFWVETLGAGLDASTTFGLPDVPDFDTVELLSSKLNGEPPWLANDVIGIGHLLAAAGITGRSLSEIIDRFSSLGLTVADLAIEDPGEIDAVDVILLSVHLNGQAPWLTSRQVPRAHVYRSACLLSCSVGEVCDRYERLGFELVGRPIELDRVTRDYATVAFYSTATTELSVDRLSIAQILAVARFAGRGADVICDSFATLGLTVPHPSSFPSIAAGALTARDMVLLSARLDGRGPWLRGSTAPVAHIIAAAGYLRWSPRRVVDRLGALGCSVPIIADSALDAFVDGVDRKLMELFVTPVKVYEDRPASRAEVLAMSFVLRWSPARIAGRLIELGFSVPSASSLVEFGGIVDL